jgi:hypothetical protein
MNTRRCTSLSALLLLLAWGAPAVVAQTPTHFSGLINDYTASPANGGPGAGPWEIHGEWMIRLQGTSGTGDFAADATMSDLGSTNGAIDPTRPGNSPHTHHIVLSNATVTVDPATLSAMCPKDSPATTPRFMLSGTVSIITGNGSDAPFEKTSPPSPPKSVLQVCVTGGNPSVDPYSVLYSNITLQFATGSKAISHFGADAATTHAIHGVVSTFN